MSKLHYFQRYSQKENVVTNNTLLLFSRLQSYSPARFEAFLNGLVETGTIEVGVRFTQQVRRGGASVPDGMLLQQSLAIVVETKLHMDANIVQLEQHLGAFKHETIQVLLLLTPEVPSGSLQEGISDIVRMHNEEHGDRIISVCSTFAKVISGYEDILEPYDYEMRAVLDDYRDFCDSAGLLPRSEFLMRGAACGATLDENFHFAIYYDPVDRSSRRHRYIGIYREKCIRGVGQIINVVTANLRGNNLDVEDATKAITDDERDRIIHLMHYARTEHGWDISMGHRFFVVERFHPTEYRKVSRGPMRGMQYFDLGGILNTDKLPATEQIALELSTKTW